MRITSEVPSARGVSTPDKRWFIGALLVTVAVSALALLLPLSSSETGPGGGSVDRVSLLEQQGAYVIFLLAVPVLVTAVPLLVPPRIRRDVAWGSVGVLAVGVFVSIVSVGFAYVPSLALLTIAAVRSR